MLYVAQQAGRLATTGPYARVRHPQYVGFILIMFGFLLQWPTLLTLAMFPVLVWMYVRLARARNAKCGDSSETVPDVCHSNPGLHPAAPATGPETGVMTNEEAMVKDPVCGMNVEESKAAGTVMYDGRTYYFCSAHCKASFEKAPEKYAGR